MSDTEIICVNAITAKAPAAPIRVDYWDGTSRDVVIEDGKADLGPAHLIKAVVVTSVSSDDCVLEVGTVEVKTVP